MNVLAHVVDGLINGAVYAEVAVGFALTFSVLNVINLTHPSFFMVAMFIGVAAADIAGSGALGLFLAAVMVMAFMSIGAVALESLVLRPIRRAPAIMSLIVTGGVAIILEYLMGEIYGNDPIAFPRYISSTLLVHGAVALTNLQVINAVLAIVITGAVVFLVYGTRTGLGVRAVAENQQLCGAFGIRAHRIIRITLIVSLCSAGIAGLGVGLLYGQAFAFADTSYGLKAFVIMLLAGNRRIEGVALMALVVGVVESLVSIKVTGTIADVVIYGMLLLILYFRPTGVFGSYELATAS